MLWRLALRLDRRLTVAAVGIGMAILLPAVGTLLLQALEPDVRRGEGWIASADDASAFGSVPASRVRALVEWSQDELWVGAFQTGGPDLLSSQVLPMPGADLTLVASRFPDFEVLPPLSQPLPLAPSDGVVVSSILSVDGATIWLDRPAPVLGAMPARGADAFEAGTIEALRNNVVWLVAASLPAVAAVAYTFVSLEADRFARTSATLAALGHPQAGRIMLLARVTLAAGLGTLFAALTTFVLWSFGPDAFHPEDTWKTGLFLALMVPGVTAIAAGALTLGRPLRSGSRQLRDPSPDALPPEARIPWLPVAARPLMLGHQIVLLFLVAGLLFTADVGMPLAAAQVPAALAGAPGEWVRGAQAGIVLGGSTDAAAAVLVHDPDVQDAVAEILVPTTMNGEPVVLRGGNWDDMARYHGFTGGKAPAPGEVVLGARLANRMHLEPGDAVLVQATLRPLVLQLQVSGFYDSPGLSGDEGFLHEDTARSLTGLKEGQATLVRVRPDSLPALAALQRTEASLEVLEVRTEPESPLAGSVFRVDATVANLGAGPGSRTLTFRVGGEPVEQTTLRLPGYQTQVVSAFAIAPEGVFQVEVNPTQDRDGGVAAAHLEASIAFADAPAPVRVTRNGEPVSDVVVSAYARLSDVGSAAALAEATTDAEGWAFLDVPVGNHTVVASGSAASLTVSPASYRDRSVIAIDRVWTTPAVPLVGETVTVHAAVVNLGGETGDHSIDFRIGDLRFAYRYVLLSPGEHKDATAQFRMGSTSETIQVDNQTVPVAGKVQSNAPILLTDPDIRSSDSLQADVADEVLGDAQRALASLMMVALMSSLAVVYLATERTLRGRVHVARILHALGQDVAAIRRRASWEAVGLTAVAFLAATLLIKMMLWSFRLAGAPVVFAHVLPDPFGVLLTTQALAAFSATAALAATLAAGAVLNEQRS